MKKTIIVLLSVMALLVFTASAFALHEVTGTEYAPGMVKAMGPTNIELGGSIRTRGEINKNTSDFFDDGEDNKQAYDTRIRLGVKAMVSNNTMGMLELETGSGDTDLWTWGNFNSKPTDMHVRQGFIAHAGSGLLGVKSGVKVGHVLLALGNNLFFDHTKFGDDAIILWTTVGGGELSYINIKFGEFNTTQNDDLDGHVLAYGTSLDGVNLSADLTYIRDHFKGSVGEFPILGEPIGLSYEGWSLYNLGLRADTAFSGVKVKGDVEIQSGKVKDVCVSPTACALFNDDFKFRGYAFMLGAEANVGPAAVRLNGAFGSGDKTDTDDKFEGFVNFLSDQQYFTYVYEYKAFTPMGTKHTGISNTWYINLGASANATPDLKVSADAYYLQLAKKLSDEKDFDSKDVGFEIDGKAEYKIDTNLVYYVEGGILFPGDAYKNISYPEDPDNAWGVRHGIMLTF